MLRGELLRAEGAPGHCQGGHRRVARASEGAAEIDVHGTMAVSPSESGPAREAKKLLFFKM